MRWISTYGLRFLVFYTATFFVHVPSSSTLPAPTMCNITCPSMEQPHLSSTSCLWTHEEINNGTLLSLNNFSFPSSPIAFQKDSTSQSINGSQSLHLRAQSLAKRRKHNADYSYHRMSTNVCQDQHPRFFN